MEEMITMSVFADTTHQYTEEEIEKDNIAEIELPRRIVWDFYKANEKQFMAVSGAYFEIPPARCNFLDWLASYTCTDTDELFDFAVQKGFTWKRPDEPETWCADCDGYVVECCSNCGAENEIRWDINKDGFEAYCPHCGAKMMLCDACEHRYGDRYNDCDWCPEHGCHMCKKKEGKANE